MTMTFADGISFFWERSPSVLPKQGIAPAQAAAAAVGSVRALSGRAEAEREAQMRLLAQEGEVFTGDRITTGTGARAVLKLGAATELRMGSAARIRIDRFLINRRRDRPRPRRVMIDKAPASGGSCPCARRTD